MSGTGEGSIPEEIWDVRKEAAIYAKKKRFTVYGL